MQPTSMKSMFDSLLGQIAGEAGRSGAGGGATPASTGSGDPLGGLSDLLSSLTGGRSTASPGATGEGQGLGDMLGGLLSGDRATLAKGAAAGGLAGALLGGKGLAKGAVAAAIGTLAYKAYKDWQAGRDPLAPTGTAPEELPSPVGTDFLPDDADALAEKLARAMVAAAKADGEVTPAEQARITSALRERGYDSSAAHVIEEELAAPLDVGRIAALATNEGEAAAIYAASLLAVDPQAPAEKGYLAMLAARLKLPPDLVAHLHGQAGTLA